MRERTLILAILLSLSANCFAQSPRAYVNGPHLLKTAWGGTAPLNAFAPEGSTLGCHANAFAQVMFFHKLAPHGKVSYKCTNGALVSEDFSDYAPEWNKFALNKESGRRDMAATRQTARFSYYVAAVIRKDFGTNQYVGYPNDYHKRSVEAHFHCTVTAFEKEIRSTIGISLREQPDFYALLKTEIDSDRPVGLYYTDRKGGGHAVVIDGYTVNGSKTYFHANFGWLGRSDGWYLLEEDLPENITEIALIVITPDGAEMTETTEPEKSLSNDAPKRE